MGQFLLFHPHISRFQFPTQHPAALPLNECCNFNQTNERPFPPHRPRRGLPRFNNRVGGQQCTWCSQQCSSPAKMHLLCPPITFTLHRLHRAICNNNRPTFRRSGAESMPSSGGSSWAQNQSCYNFDPHSRTKANLSLVGWCVALVGLLGEVQECEGGLNALAMQMNPMTGKCNCEWEIGALLGWFLEFGCSSSGCSHITSQTFGIALLVRKLLDCVFITT